MLVFLDDLKCLSKHLSKVRLQNVQRATHIARGLTMALGIAFSFWVILGTPLEAAVKFSSAQRNYWFPDEFKDYNTLLKSFLIETPKLLPVAPT